MSGVIYDEFGDEVLDDDIVPDRGKVIVPALLMDHARRFGDGGVPKIHDGLGGTATLGHRPGYAFPVTTPLQDGQREDMLQRRKEMLSEAWRNPRPAPVLDDESVDDAVPSFRPRWSRWPQQELQQRQTLPSGTSSQALHERRKKWLSEAWRRR